MTWAEYKVQSINLIRNPKVVNNNEHKTIAEQSVGNSSTSILLILCAKHNKVKGLNCSSILAGENSCLPGPSRTSRHNIV